jgi:hypothetical protein
MSPSAVMCLLHATAMAFGPQLLCILLAAIAQKLHGMTSRSCFFRVVGYIECIAVVLIRAVNVTCTTVLMQQLIQTVFRWFAFE